MAVFSRSRRRLLLGGAAVAGLLRPAPSQAGALSVNPVLVTFRPGQTMATFEVANRGGTPTATQIRLFAWSQNGDEDVLTPTTDLLASPPLFDIKADEEQIVRLVQRRPSERLERTYRLILDEIPQAGGAREIVVALRISLPVIVAGTSPASPDLTWRAERGQGNQLILAARNAGRRHIRVNLLEALLPQQRGAVAAKAISGNPFVLAGAERRWSLALPAGASPGGTLRLRMQSDTGSPSEFTVPLSS